MCAIKSECVCVCAVERRERQCERAKDCGIDKLIDNNGNVQIKREENGIQSFLNQNQKNV